MLHIGLFRQNLQRSEVGESLNIAPKSKEPAVFFHNFLELH